MKQLRTNLDYAVEYRGEEINGNDAKVSTVVKVRTRAKSTDMDIDYKLHKVADRWMVYDVVTDDVSMVNNYRSQFHKIITEKSFDELKARIAKTVAYLNGFKPADIDASADKDVTFPIGPQKTMTLKGAQYLVGFGLPNFYFHATTAYDILRHAGVELGKMDFIGRA